ncbi:MAG: hypothetical protein KBG45_09450, partial [Ottowia sp.]|nr:hypothetical protein [Ottowia sp.]
GDAGGDDSASGSGVGGAAETATRKRSARIARGGAGRGATTVRCGIGRAAVMVFLGAGGAATGTTVAATGRAGGVAVRVSAAAIGRSTTLSANAGAAGGATRPGRAGGAGRNNNPCASTTAATSASDGRAPGRSLMTAPGRETARLESIASGGDDTCQRWPHLFPAGPPAAPRAGGIHATYHP